MYFSPEHTHEEQKIVAFSQIKEKAVLSKFYEYIEEIFFTDLVAALCKFGMNGLLLKFNTVHIVSKFI